MRTWRSPMSATSQGAFVVIPEIIAMRYFLDNKKTIKGDRMKRKNADVWNRDKDA